MEENLFFKNSKGDNLSATISVVNQEAPIIILGHGFASSKNGSSKEIADILNSKNINSFRFDFYGHGESDGEFKNITVSEGSDDILSAIKFCKDKGFKKIVLLGTSFGGACSIIAASKSEDLSLLVLRSPVSDYSIRELMLKTKEELDDWKTKGFRIYKSSKGKDLELNYTFFEDMKNNRGFIEAEKIKIPTFIVHGSRDENVPIILSEMLVKVISNCKLEVIEGADHRYSDKKHDEKAKELLISFIVSKV